MGQPGSSPNWLSSWSCRYVTESATDSDERRCSFDLDNIDLLYPSHGATVALPLTFTWRMRSLPNDDYVLRITEFADFDPYWAVYAGHTGSYTLDALPSGFVPGQEYGWWLTVVGPDGTGTSYYYRTVTFSSYGDLRTTRTVPQTGDRLEMASERSPSPQSPDSTP